LKEHFYFLRFEAHPSDLEDFNVSVSAVFWTPYVCWRWKAVTKSLSLAIYLEIIFLVHFM
jgi:hypothetical protein